MDNHLCETLHHASRDGHFECIRILLDSDTTKCNINEKSDYGWTPHANASLTGSLCIIE
jgi:hypothetical protein